MKAIKAVFKVLPFSLVLCSIYVLEYFGRKRMGMMRYLVFMKREFDNGLFQPMMTFGLFTAAAVLTAYVLWRLLRSDEKQKRLLTNWFSALAVLDVWMLLPQTRALKSYHFGLIGWLIITACTTAYSLWQLSRKN